jgi:hypothetical protein
MPLRAAQLSLHQFSLNSPSLSKVLQTAAVPKFMKTGQKMYRTQRKFIYPLSKVCLSPHWFPWDFSHSKIYKYAYVITFYLIQCPLACKYRQLPQLFRSVATVSWQRYR